MKIPENFKVYKKTPLYDQDSIPNELSMMHETGDGIWEKLIVVFGSVDYVDCETGKVTKASPVRSVSVEPHHMHSLHVTGPVELYVEYYKAA